MVGVGNMVKEKVPVFSFRNAKEPVFVLLVEDDKSDAFMACRTVYNITEKSSKYDYFLDHAPSLKDALAALATDKYSAVLLDLSLTDAENLEAVDAIKAEFPQIPIIVLTNNENRHVQIDAKVKGVEDYLLKRHLSNNPHEVAQALDRTIK